MSNLKQLFDKKGRASIATTLAITILMLTTGFYFLLSPIQAASLGSVKDTLSTSAPATVSNHTIQFITQTAIKNSDTIKLEWDTIAPADEFGFPTNFASTSIDFATSSAGNCAAIQTSGGDETIETSAFFGNTQRFKVDFNTTTDDITFTATSTAGTYIATSSCIVVRVGTNAVFQASGSIQITNPAKTAAVGTADVNDIKITFTGTPAADSGSALVATIEGVTVSVTVDSSLSFSIAPVTSGNCTQQSTGAASTTITTTTTTVPFGSSGVATNAFYRGCHTLTISTNASSGYAITEEENQSLKSSAGNLIADTNCDTNCSATIANAKPWATNTNNGLGFSCAGNSCNTTFSTSSYARFACTGASGVCTPSSTLVATTFISTSTPVSNNTSTVVYQLSLSGTQAAGQYSNTITYIATPTF